MRGELVAERRQPRHRVRDGGEVVPGDAVRLGDGGESASACPLPHPAGFTICKAFD
jgi:hypothetical protein